jgi:nucleoside-diphosphate-sugar epimerase
MTKGIGSTCLVTGCAGNVGSNLTKELLAKGFHVVGVDNFFSGLPANMVDFIDHPAFAFHERSITDKRFMAKLIAKQAPLAAIFHLAAIISVPYSMDHADETMEINHEASLYLHEKAEEYRCGAFIFAGSAAEYGKPLSRPAAEEDAGDPLSPYGLSKHLVSLAIEASGYGCALRFFNIYGPTRSKPGPYDGVVRSFLDRTQQGLSPVIHGDGLQMRDFLFLKDAVRALLTAAGFLPGGPLSGIYNVGTGHGVTIKTLAALTLRLAGSDGTPEFSPVRQGDIHFSVAENSKLLRHAGWVPDTPLEYGLTLTIEGMRTLAGSTPQEIDFRQCA